MAAAKQLLSFFIPLLFLIRVQLVHGHPNYSDALAKSITFFQGQRSGSLPGGQQIRWRANSGLTDGSAASVDLVGGYYDAGDNVKFGFPMAFTTTMLSWSVIEYGKRMAPQLDSARAAVRWATDYLLKASAAVPTRLYVGVGDPNADHQCWERAEDMDTPRTVYSVSPANPGSDVAGETAAALAAAALVFRAVDKPYSQKLLKAAKRVMAFAVKYQGRYSDSLGSAACPFYCSYSGYKVIGMSCYGELRGYIEQQTMSPTSITFNLYEQMMPLTSLAGITSTLGLEFFSLGVQAEDFMCKTLPNSPSSTTQYTPGGLMHKMSSGNLQYVTSASFLLSTYAKYMASSSHTFTCGNLLVTEKLLRAIAKKQVDYILGDNPLKMSYMVGFGDRYPQKIHHRGSSIPSFAAHPMKIGCKDGFQYLDSSSPNPNTLTGAVVGGPDENDAFPDDRNDYSHSEPTTYINAPLVGCLAYFMGSYGSG